MIALIVAVVLGLVSSGTGAANVCRCDLIEFNNVAGSQFVQVIFWRWNPECARYDVRSWCLQQEVSQVDTHTVYVRGFLVRGRIWHTTTYVDRERANVLVCLPEDRLPMPFDTRGKSRFLPMDSP